MLVLAPSSPSVAPSLPGTHGAGEELPSEQGSASSPSALFWVKAHLILTLINNCVL